MDPLPVADQHCLRAAEGWLDLGNPREAEAELNSISAPNLAHPDVLHFRWQIHRKTRHWDVCYEVAQQLASTVPDDPRGWTSLAQTLYFTERVQEAYDLAVSKITTFPAHWPLYYDAACYACLTGRLPQARKFLELAATLGSRVEVELLAAQDPDLAALREEQ